MTSRVTMTPMMTQYQEMKKKHPDAILLFRIGDFYETFGEDAVIASKILGITLTHRANGTSSFIELSGIPHHALDVYLPKLVRAGKRVAICEQLEDPKLTKKTEKREVVELITPNNQPKIKAQIGGLFAVIADFSDILNKLSIFEDIRAKTQEIRSLALTLGISPMKAFQACYNPVQPSLFD